jgi:hypothetical protein
MKKLLITLSLLAIFAIGSAQEPFKGFFKVNVSKALLQQSDGLKAIGKPVVLVRPAFSMNAFKIMKSDIPGESLDISSLQSGGMGISLVFYNDTTTNFSIDALALTSLDLSGATPFSVSPALAIKGWNIISAGIGRDTYVNKWFGLINITYSFTKVK